MAGFAVSVQQSAPLTVEMDAKSAVDSLTRLGAGMRNPAPVVDGLARAMRQHVHTAFAVGGFPSPWVPNKLNTVVAKGHSKPLFRSRGKSGIEQKTFITVTQNAQEFSITTTTSAIGRFHQEGRTGPWTIVPKNAPFLSFIVAGERFRGRTVLNLGDEKAEVRAAFRARRASAQARRKATGRGSIPGRPNAMRAYALKVTHPGYPARPFMPPMDPATAEGSAFLQKHWRDPLREYLFGQYAGLAR